MTKEERDNISSLKTDYPKKWSYKTVQRILNNPFYIGHRLWNRYENRTKKKRIKDIWIVVEDDHPALITEDEYFRVFKLLKT